MASLSPDQFPEHVPDKLALGAANPRVFNDTSAWNEGGEQTPSQIAEFNKKWTDPGMGGHRHVIPAYAPTAADFKEMPAPIIEGRVPAFDAGRSGGVLVELDDHPVGVNTYGGRDSVPSNMNHRTRRIVV